MNNMIEEILISEEEILNTCKILGKQITNDYKGKDLILVGLLKGCIPFLSDLAKHIDLPLEIHYFIISSYHGTTTSSNIIIKHDIEVSLKDKDVLLVEDIVDTGKTIKTVINLFKNRGAKSIKIVSLLKKEEKNAIKIDYLGFSIPNKFVLGYGLDFDQKYRNLPYIGVLKKEFYDK